MHFFFSFGTQESGMLATSSVALLTLPAVASDITAHTSENLH
jgi:hypothetical protein